MSQSSESVDRSVERVAVSSVASSYGRTDGRTDGRTTHPGRSNSPAVTRTPACSGSALSGGDQPLRGGPQRIQRKRTAGRVVSARLVDAYPDGYVWLVLGQDPAVCPAVRNDAPLLSGICGRPVAYLVSMRPGKSQWVHTVGVCVGHTIVVRAQDAAIITEVRTAA